MEFRHLLVRNADRIRRITLNRPERLNALNVRIGVELLQALDDADRDSKVRVAVLTGAGRAFCAGDDLRGMDEPGAPVRRFDDPIKQYVLGEGRWPLIVARMRAMSKPAIAMVNGHAHGAGFNLALGCDLRVIAADATLAIPFSRRGIGTGTNLLQQFVGIGKAMEWALLAPTLSAHEAERWGSGQPHRSAGSTRGCNHRPCSATRKRTDARLRSDQGCRRAGMGGTARDCLPLPGLGRSSVAAHGGLQGGRAGLYRKTPATVHRPLAAP